MAMSGEGIYLDGLWIKLQTLFLIGEELLNILALIALKLDHLSHLSIDDNGAIASYYSVLVPARVTSYSVGANHTELLFDDLEDLLLIEFLG